MSDANAKQWYKLTCAHCDQLMVWEDDLGTHYGEFGIATCPRCKKSCSTKHVRTLSELAAQVLLVRSG